jgi:hypothetical protein
MCVFLPFVFLFILKVRGLGKNQGFILFFIYICDVLSAIQVRFYGVNHKGGGESTGLFILGADANARVSVFI